MDFLKSARRKTMFALTALLILLAARVSSAAEFQYIYDYANILTSLEKERLHAIAREYSDELNVHFVILTIDEASESSLERYSRNFYESNIAGAGGIFECAMMSINMGTRRVANDFYGELRTMVSDGEASVIREGYTSDMSKENYEAAARYFLDEAAKLVEKKLALYNIDVPEVDPANFVYDFSGRLSDGERNDLIDRTRAASLGTKVGHIIVILEAADKEYLKRFANSFYKKNFKDSGLFEGWFILAVSPGTGEVSVSPFGTYQPTNSVIWNMESAVGGSIESYSLYDGCLHFPARQADAFQAADFEMPQMDYSRKILDFADSLTDEQEERLRNAILERQNRYGVDLLIILSDFSMGDTLNEFDSNIFADYLRTHSGGACLYLLIGAPPELKGGIQYVNVRRFGKKAERKMDDNRLWDIRENIRAILGDGDYYAAGEAFIDDVSKLLKSPIPNVRMADRLGWALQISLLAAVALPGIALLIIRLMHNAGMRRKAAARNYLVDDSLRLHYISDVFLHTHTTRTRIERDSDSGSSGGSSGGGTSSRSEGSF